MSNDMDLHGRLALAVETARRAGALLLEYQDRRLTVVTKSSDTDTVSEADHASEVLIMSALDEAYGDDGLLGEEDEANRDGTTGMRWVVDPLDGTVNYLHRLPAWCVSIACEDTTVDASVVGVVHDPLHDETFVAVGGGGAELLIGNQSPGQGRALGVTDVPVGQCLVATGFGYDQVRRAVQERLLVGLAPGIADLRRLGAAALDLAWTAAGRLDGFVEHGLGPWDRAAGTLLVQEAGGCVRMVEQRIGEEQLLGVFAGSSTIVDHLAAHYDRTIAAES